MTGNAWFEHLDVPAIIVVGLIATGCMSLAHWLLEWHPRRHYQLVRALTAFAMPAPLRSNAMTVALHLSAGIFFAGAYSFVFDFVAPSSILKFAEIGALIGLGHGFFLGVFFYGLDPVVGPARFSPALAASNVLSHLVFGVVVGLGLGLVAHTGTVIWFGVFGIAALAAAAGLLQLLSGPTLSGGGRRRWRTRRA